jgi:hypothetical protein
VESSSIQLQPGTNNHSKECQHVILLYNACVFEKNYLPSSRRRSILQAVKLQQRYSLPNIHVRRPSNVCTLINALKNLGCAQTAYLARNPDFEMEPSPISMMHSMIPIICNLSTAVFFLLVSKQMYQTSGIGIR